MARVYVFERAVDAVFTDVKLDEKSNPSEHGLKIKKEPLDPDKNTTDDSPSVTVNTGDRNSVATLEDESSGAVNRRENECALSQEPADSENKRANFVKVVRKSLLSKDSKAKDATHLKTKGTTDQTAKPVRSKNREAIQKGKRCDVCFLMFRSIRALKIHNKLSFNKEFECEKCHGQFSNHASWSRHRSNLTCETKRETKYICNFCSRTFFAKDTIQKHLFHIHGDLIHSGKTGSGVTENANGFRANPTPEASENLNGFSEASKKKFNDSYDTPLRKLWNLNDSPLKILTSPTSIPLKRSHSSSSTPSRKSNNSRDSIVKRLKLDRALYSTPSKRMRQTTLTDFMPMKTECVSPRKMNDTEHALTPSSYDATIETPKTSKDTKISTPVRRTDTDAPPRGIPFVRIHVDSSVMIQLLSKEIKTEPQSPSASSDGTYNLRPGRMRFSDSMNLVEPFRKRKRSPDTCRQSRRSLSWDQRSKVKFNCKECSVRLERCDKFLIRTNSKLNECVIPAEQVNSEQLHGEIKSAATIKPESKTPLKVVEIPLVPLTKPDNLCVTKSATPLKRPDSPQRKVKSKPDKLHHCHVCDKRFSLKENLHEHLELFHVIYMSSICNARYTSMNKLLNHYMRQHLVFKRKECCVCFEKFKSLALVRRHMVLHCLKTIRSKKDKLPVDVETNCNGIKKRHKCKGCRKRFWLNSCLVQHQKVCRRMNDRKDKHQTLYIKRSPSSFLERSNNLKSDDTDAPRTLDCSARYPSNDHPVQAADLGEEPLVKKSESPKGSAPNSPTTTDARLSSPLTAVSHKRLINGVACVKGYQVHMPDKIKFPCTICGKQFHTFQNLCLHERTFCKPANNRCNVCGTAFPTKRLLQLHMLATHTPSCAENYRFFCKFCNQGFLKKGNLQIHERHFHVDQVPKPWPNTDRHWNVNPVCNICNLIFESYERFIEHNMYYYRGQVFVCTFCNESFEGMYRLHHHNKSVHYPESARKSYVYTCDVCNEGFNYESHFHAHKLHVHLHDSNGLENTLTTMQDHNYALASNNVTTAIEPMEVPAKTYTCSVCNLNFTNEKDLSLHEVEYSTDGEFRCNKCNRKCRTSAILAKHQSLNHAGCDIDNSYKCRFCGEISTTSMSMVCHEKHFHENNTKSAKDNDTSSQLKPDSSIDKAETPDCNVTCLTCGMKFDDEITLKHHLLEYSNIGAYSCAICHRKFTEMYLLDVHKMKHCKVNGVLSPHRCPICNEGFANVTNVRTHVLHLHRYESFGSVLNGDEKCNRSEKSEDATCARRDKNPDSSTPSTNLTDSSNGSAPSTAARTQQENTVTCPECHIAFSSNKNLMKHRSRFVDAGDNQCSICGRRFPWVATLEQHLRKHSDTENRWLKHKCPYCAEKFRSSVAVYTHIVHTHDKDKLLHPGSDASRTLGTDSNGVDAEVSSFNENGLPVKQIFHSSEPEGSERVAVSSEGRPTDRNKVTTVAEPRTTVVNGEDVNERATESRPEKTAEKTDISDNTEKAFYYTCTPCNSKYPTLKRFQAHFKPTHEKSGQTTGTPSKEAICTGEADSRIGDSNFVDDQELYDRMLKLHTTSDDSPSNETAPKGLDPPMQKQDSDLVEIIWQKEKNPVECITITDNADDPDVQVVDELRRPFAMQQAKGSLTEDLIELDKDVGKLKVKSFAKIVG